MMSNIFIERANKEILKVNMVTLINCNKLYFLIYTTNFYFRELSFSVQIAYILFYKKLHAKL
jgi:hypothetical protein